MRSSYDQSCPSIDTEKHIINHNHSSHIDTSIYTNYGYEDKKAIHKRIDSEVSSLKGCITFFKAVSKSSTDPMTRAHALATVVEDEERVKEFKKMDPNKSSCAIL